MDAKMYAESGGGSEAAGEDSLKTLDSSSGSQPSQQSSDDVPESGTLEVETPPRTYAKKRRSAMPALDAGVLREMSASRKTRGENSALFLDGVQLALHQSEAKKDAYHAYRALCDYHGIAPNSTAAICLYTRSHRLSLSALGARFGRNAQELELIPIIELLLSDAADFVTELDLRALRLTAASAMLIGELLASPQCALKRLDVSRNLLRDAGAAYILEGARKNTALEHLELASNRIGPGGAKVIARLLNAGCAPALRSLDLVNNNMEQRGVDLVSTSCEARNLPAFFLDGNHVLSEILNGITHGIGIVGAFLAGSSMVREAVSSSALDAWLLSAVVVFAAAVFMTFTSSCLYHSFFRLGKVKKVLRVMDHCSIFTLIASTYTPFLLRYIWLPPASASTSWWTPSLGAVMFVVVWGAALLGIVMSARVLRYTPSSKFRASLGLGMGWVVVLSLKTMLERMPFDCLLHLVVGGLFYTLGVPFYLKGREVSIFHVVWHVATLLGAATHFRAVLLYVVRNPQAATAAMAPLVADAMTAVS